MKLNVVFGPGEVDYHTTNFVYGQPTEEILKVPGIVVVPYTLNNLPLTKKFVAQYRKIRARNVGKYPVFHTNYYVSAARSLLRDARIAMNQTIDRLAELEIYIDKSLHLNIDNLDDPEYDKLNELHFRFEKEQIAHSDTDPRYEERFKLLEAINNLVHYVERTPRTANEWQVAERESVFNISVRNSLLDFNDYSYHQLLPEDYINFSWPRAGDLVADFSTVGKDLMACFCTNDMELISRHEVKPQTKLTDWIFMHFDCAEKVDTIEQRLAFYDWVDQNKVADHLDVEHPMYTPGRHVLGRCDSPFRTGQEFYDAVISKAPVFLGYYFSDDRGENIEYE